MSLVGAFIVPHPPLIIPEVGKGEEKMIAATIESYREVAKRIADLNPDTIIITSPHTIMYSDYFHISPGRSAKGDFGRFGAKKVAIHVNYDEEFVEALEFCAEREGIEAGTLGEKDPSLDHGTMVPLYFINEYLKEYKVVRIGLSGLSFPDHYHLGKCITKTAEKLNRRIVFVASGDLSHKLKEDGPYGYAEKGVRFDQEVTEAMRKGSFLDFMEFSPDFCEAAAECGLRSFIIMSGALSGRAVASDLLSYEGPFGVGYAVCEFILQGEDEGRHFDEIFTKKQKELARERQKSEDVYVHLARLSLETYLTTGKKLKLPDDLPEEMLKNKAGVFVSLKKHGSLRGCIGTISPITANVANEIIRNAISAGVEDPRFPPVTEAELDELIYSVDVLAEPEPIENISELDEKRYGVIISSGRKRGLLLPNLEGVDSVEKQIAIAKKKAGIYDNEAFTMERFEVVRHR
ncbi:AmmeMemoRadiSam system protein A [Lachnospiraceae bacterium MD1]|uniref:AmmeMemoRadiSam system protein A n=1 Tax=Variimorphobacter saccharofermentans TaxID=2755051 RepID=A0A839JWB7_9FIRM|nr:AmmeMemoRadiSam system protein A [Variimorphobacter saccharofermentans]MBB2181302.1 AmmeMemoRadiSam system protein A [Variimorphobacter saccharofermentans]